MGGNGLLDRRRRRHLAMVITGDEVIQWVSSRIENTQFFNAQGIGVVKDNQIVAGVVVDQYSPNARCSIHCAGEGKNWLSKEFLFVVFDYVFRQLNVNVVINTVSSDNQRSIRLTEHIGYELVARVKGGCGDSDLFIYAMNKADCKWLRLKEKNYV